jgi:hypothetical protein
MSALTQKLERLKLQQKELEKKIKEEEEYKKKLNNEGSIERLEALIKPISKYLDDEHNIKTDLEKEKITSIRKFFEDSESDDDYESDDDSNDKDDYYIQHYHKPRNIDHDWDTLKNEEIYVTLLEILKKQNEKIKILELELNKLKNNYS